jgi:hypothetical protein
MRSSQQAATDWLRNRSRMIAVRARSWRGLGIPVASISGRISGINGASTGSTSAARISSADGCDGKIGLKWADEKAYGSGGADSHAEGVKETSQRVPAYLLNVLCDDLLSYRRDVLSD